MIRPLNEDDFEQLLKLREVGFFQQFDPNNQSFNESVRKRLSHTTGYFIKGQLASAITIYPFEMNFAGTTLPFAGLSGVMTAPEFRRKGHIRSLLSEAFERLKDTTPWCLEYPFDPRYYQQFGFQSVANGAALALPIHCLPETKVIKAERLFKDDLSRLEPIYQNWSKHYSFSLVRNNAGRESWQRLIKEFWESRERRVYLLQDAYCIFDFSYGEANLPNRLSVHDYAFASKTGREQLFGFLAGFKGQADIVELHLTANDPLEWDYALEYPKKSSTLQARILNVRAALEPLVSQYNTSFILEISDAFCPWNHKSFQVEMDQGSTRLTETTVSADISMPITSLALLVSGTITADSAQLFGLFEGQLGAARALTSLSSGKLPFMPKSDFF